MIIYSAETKPANMLPNAEWLEQWGGANWTVSGLYSRIEADCITFILRMSKEMISDGLSVPNEVEDRIKSTGKYLGMGLDHDANYKGRLFPRWFADLFFREHMSYADCHRHDKFLKRCFSWFIRHVSYYLLRLFGWIAWNGYTFDQIAQFRAGIEIEIIACSAELMHKLLEHEQQMTKQGFPHVFKFTKKGGL